MFKRFLKTTAPLAACLARWCTARPVPLHDRPIKMIVAYSAGGATDVTARAITPFIEKYLGGGARIVIENRTGAGGVSASPPSPLHRPTASPVGFVNTPNLLTIPIERKSSFTWESFDLIGNVVDDPSNFSVLSSDPITAGPTGCLCAQQARPGHRGHHGVGSDDHLAMLMFEKIAGEDEPRALQGRRRRALGHPGQADRRGRGEHRRGPAGHQGRRAVSQFRPDEPDPYRPGAGDPHLQGAGLQHRAVLAAGHRCPQGLSADVRERLVSAVAKATADPEFIKISLGFYASLRYLAPAQYTTVLREAETGFRKLWTELPWGDK